MMAKQPESPARRRPGAALPLHGLQERINALLEEFWEKIGSQHAAVSGRAYSEVPADTDLTTGAKDLRVEIELPGMDVSDIEVEASEHELTVRGEKRLEREHSGRTYHISERAFGSFARTIRLPADVNLARAKATYRNGVLTVTVPRKTGAAAGKKIKIASR